MIIKNISIKIINKNTLKASGEHEDDRQTEKDMDGRTDKWMDK